MIICLCNNITDRQINASIRGGAETAAQVYQRQNATPQCGKCACDIREMIAAHQEAALSTTTTAGDLPALLLAAAVTG